MYRNSRAVENASPYNSIIDPEIVEPCVSVFIGYTCTKVCVYGRVPIHWHGALQTGVRFKFEIDINLHTTQGHIRYIWRTFICFSEDVCLKLSYLIKKDRNNNDRLPLSDIYKGLVPDMPIEDPSNIFFPFLLLEISAEMLPVACIVTFVWYFYHTHSHTHACTHIVAHNIQSENETKTQVMPSCHVLPIKTYSPPPRLIPPPSQTYESVWMFSNRFGRNRSISL